MATMQEQRDWRAAEPEPLAGPMSDRLTLLQRLITKPCDAGRIVQELSVFPWDSPIDLVTLEPQHIVTVLERFQSGSLDAETVHRWADALEFREDVGFGPGCIDAVFTLANPDINGTLTLETARKLMLELSG